MKERILSLEDRFAEIFGKPTSSPNMVTTDFGEEIIAPEHEGTSAVTKKSKKPIRRDCQHI